MPIIFSLLRQLIGLLSGSSSDAPDVNTQVGPTTQYPTSNTALIKIERKTITNDGVFGEISVNGDSVCVCAENLARLVPEGLYDAKIDLSPRLGYNCPHLQVRDRDLAAGGDAGIRIHIANRPSELEGCIAPGSELDTDSVDNSRKAFDKLMALLPAPGVSFKVLIYSLH